MNLDEFEKSVSEETAPNLPVQLLALWYDARNDWESAHGLVNDLEDKDAAWVHAYLHRKEGDLGNAAYWYRRAGKEISPAPLKDEWRAIAGSLLEKIKH